MTQSTAIPTTTSEHTTDALAAVFSVILQDPLVDPRRLLRAATLLDDVERLADGRWICPASDGKAAYHIVGGLCGCPDATYRDPRRCAHALAVQAYQLLERAEAEAGQPADPPCICQPAHGIICAAHGNQIARAQAAAARFPGVPDPDAEIPYQLTSKAIALLEPHRECAACDGHPAADHDGPDGQCGWHGVDAEGWWQCDCAGFQTDDPEGVA